jgi:hypothetical protein
MHGFTTEYARLNLGDKPGDPPGIFLTGVKKSISRGPHDGHMIIDQGGINRVVRVYFGKIKSHIVT